MTGKDKQYLRECSKRIHKRFAEFKVSTVAGSLWLTLEKTPMIPMERCLILLLGSNSFAGDISGGANDNEIQIGKDAREGLLSEPSNNKTRIEIANRYKHFSDQDLFRVSSAMAFSLVGDNSIGLYRYTLERKFFRTHFCDYETARHIIGAWFGDSADAEAVIEARETFEIDIVKLMLELM